MIGTKLQKPLQDDFLHGENGEQIPNDASNTTSKYTELAHWCNANNATIADRGEYYECVAIPEPTLEERSERIRGQRDAKLQETDVYLLSDYPISETERTQVVQYRQQLRDLPMQAGFPDEIVWPENPLETSQSTLHLPKVGI